jgi:hypothetical protein
LAWDEFPFLVSSDSR